MSHKETRERLEELVGNKLALAEELTKAGADSPHTDGLSDLRDDVKGVVVPKGKRTQETVSFAGRVSRGQFVQKLPEYAPQGEPLRWGLEDVHVLDVGRFSEGRVGIVFAQNGETKIKVVALNEGQIALGNTLTLVEDEALEAARVIEVARNVLLVAYNYEGAGVGTVIDLDGRVATTRYSDIWSSEDPENICLCPLNGSSAMITEVRQASNYAGEIWAHYVRLGQTAFESGYAGDVLVNVEHDQDIYAMGWSLCRVNDSTAVLCYPVALDRPIGIVILDLEPVAYYDTSTIRTIRVRTTANGKYAASLPCIATAGAENAWLVAYGVGWLSADKQVTESTLAIECWSLTRYGAELQWYSCEEVRCNESVGCVGIELYGDAITAAYIGAGKSNALTIQKPTTVGPTVSLGEGETLFRLVPVAENKLLKITQKGGNGYVQICDVVWRVSKSKTLAYGTAMSGGGPGEVIAVMTAGETEE